MAYRYERGALIAVGTQGTYNLAQIAKDAGGPVYVYNLAHIADRVNFLKSAFKKIKPSIHYAMKANDQQDVLRTLREAGALIDTVSAGEVKIAIKSGFQADQIIFSGVAKSKDEIAYALKTGIKQINVESPSELRRIAQIAKDLKIRASVAFRMNPDVNPQTHPYITTGFRDNKFGMDDSFLPELIEILRSNPESLNLRGLTLHIGSQLLELTSLKEAIEKTKAVFLDLKSKGFTLDRFDVGGGIGINYQTDDETSERKLLSEYAAMVDSLLSDLGVEIILEPGRTLVARSGLLIGEVQYIKDTQYKKFAILNTGMNHLLRPALYQAKHRVLPLNWSNSATQTYDIVGPICESADFLAQKVELPELHEGDFIAIADAGAYGRVMASHYNAHDLPKEVALK